MKKVSRIISSFIAFGLMFGAVFGLNGRFQAFGIQNDGIETGGEEFRVNRYSDNLGDFQINYDNFRFIFNFGAVDPLKMYEFKLVYRNFNEGITEEMADEAARTLGEEDFSTWAIEVGHAANKKGFNPGVLVQPTIGYEAMKANLTDQFYYAMKLADPDNQENPIWVRGKVSHRECFKSPLFRKDATKCEFTRDGDSYKTVLKTLDNQVLGLPEGYSIPDWDDEWRAELYKRYNEATGIINTANNYLKNFDYFAGRANDLLVGLTKTVHTASYLEQMADNLPGTQADLADILAYYKSLQPNTDSGTKITELENRISLLEAENQNLKTENGKLENDLEHLTLENQRLKDELAELKSETPPSDQTVKDLTEKNRELEEKIKVLQSQGSELESKVKNLEGQNTDLQSYISILEREKAELGKKVEEINSSLKQTMLNLEKSERQCAGIGNLGSKESNLNSLSNPTNISTGGSGNNLEASRNQTTTEQSSTVLQVESQDQNQGQISANAEGQASAEAQNQEELSVPRLGGDHAFKWIGVGLIAFAFGLIVLWLKRAFLHRK